jgi:hypothetical protein
VRDQILEALLGDFVETHAMGELGESQAFEHFAGYCVVSKHHPETFDPGDVSVGGPGDLGLDAVAILVSDHIVRSIAEVDHFRNQLKKLEVKFIFMQAKSSPHFDGKDINQFIQGVRAFFTRALPSEANQTIRNLYDVKEHIYKSSKYFDLNPICHLYYVCTGKLDSSSAFKREIDTGHDDLKKLNLFSAIEFTLVDSDSLRRLYRQLEHKLTREIVFDKFAILPRIRNVKESYIGIIPSLEYLKLITDEDGDLNKRLFYDNVRDFQGHNPVNLEMEATLKAKMKATASPSLTMA